MESEVRHPARERISVDVARRIALAGQGLTDPRPSGRVDARHVRRVIDRVGVGTPLVPVASDWLVARDAASPLPG